MMSETRAKLLPRSGVLETSHNILASQGGIFLENILNGTTRSHKFQDGCDRYLRPTNERPSVVDS